ASAPEREGAEPADSTTTSAAPDAVGLCEVLTTEPFEVRRAALTASEPEAVEAAKDECSNAMRRLDAAVEVMETADALDTGQSGLSVADPCVGGASGVFQPRLSIRALDVPVSGLRTPGVAGTVRLRHDGDEIPGSIGELYD